MSAAAELLYDAPPGFHFRPLDDELVELYLLPRVRGQPDLFPGLIIEDDAAANTQPWVLFDRHGRSHAVPAFFFVRTNGAARPDRRCHDDGTWKSMKCEREDANHEMVVDGEKIKWQRHNLNLHMSTGKKGGSNGWVMHEYTITTNPSLKLCRISFSGYCQKRKRVPDGYDGDEPMTQRPRVAAQESGSATSGSGRMTFDQGFSTAHASEDGELLHNSSDAAMLAEMTNWEFQAEQLQMMNTSAPQEPPSSCSTTTTLSQESGLTQDGSDLEPLELLSDDAIAEVLDIIAQPMADGEPYQQVPVMDQSSCGVPNIGDANIVHWEGFDLDLSFF
ncbi:hypothetical protein EJB05_30188, partial [Eragrostis curvula]